MVPEQPSPGAVWLGDGRTRFRIWAPGFDHASVHLLFPRDMHLPMKKDAMGHHEAVAEGVAPGALYKIRLGDLPERPDPASRFQPQGSHGPSQVVDPSFPWTDGRWRGLPLESLVFYEMHVGTFTPEGTFEAAIRHLDGLVDLGVTAVELMPVAQFPGARNWGYDGTFPFAVQNTYGGPAGLQRFVNECHRRGLAVALDVVYNHLGHEGNYLWGMAPFFTDRYKTPWGSALNFDGPDSDEVREFFIQSALWWVRFFHVDALRLDAVHAIMDSSARPFLGELAERIRAAAGALGRQVHLIAGSDRNDPRLVRPAGVGGYGLDAVWNDDFHHALHVLLTGEREGYYRDFGRLDQLGRAISGGFVYTGQYSEYRRRRHGAPSDDLEPRRLVVFAQNHDQVGNRMLGERLAALVPFEKLKLAAGVVILSPNIPLLFMGEEYGETAPFQYFVDYSDQGLVEGTRRGRREEFAGFLRKGEPPDPQDEAAFRGAPGALGVLKGALVPPAAGTFLGAGPARVVGFCARGIVLTCHPQIRWRCPSGGHLQLFGAGGGGFLTRGQRKVAQGHRLRGSPLGRAGFPDSVGIGPGPEGLRSRGPFFPVRIPVHGW